MGWILPPSLSVRQRRRRRSEEHTSELQSQSNLVCRLLLEKKNRSSPFLAIDAPFVGMPTVDSIIALPVRSLHGRPASATDVPHTSAPPHDVAPAVPCHSRT